MHECMRARARSVSGLGGAQPWSLYIYVYMHRKYFKKILVESSRTAGRAPRAGGPGRPVRIDVNVE